MVKITGNFGKVKSWIKRLIRVQDTGNLFVGTDTGLVTTSNYNTFVGYQAGYLNTSGARNNFVGYKAGYSNTSGLYNNFMGYQTGYKNTTGALNNFMGYNAGYSNTSGASNTFIGYNTGYSNTSGAFNTFIGGYSGYYNAIKSYNTYLGYYAGYSNSTGELNVSIGYKAGVWETGDNKLFIDNAARIDEADGRIKALIYGVFDTATANQLVRLNAILQLTEIKNGSTQANAGAAANEVWKTNGHASLPDNVLMIGV